MTNGCVLQLSDLLTLFQKIVYKGSFLSKLSMWFDVYDDLIDSALYVTEILYMP